MPFEERDIETFFFDKSEDVPDPSSLDKTKNNLMIFDDLMLENTAMCEKYYTRGRHANCDCFFLSQNFIEIPKHSIRDNFNFLIMFPQDEVNLKSVWNACASCDMKFEDFKNFCRQVWQKKHNYVVIDKTREISDGRYREGIDKFWDPIENS